MKVTVKATNLKLTPEIAKAIEEKIGTLDKFLSGARTPLEAFVEVALETRHHQKGKIFYAEADIKFLGEVIRAESSQDNIYKAINTVKDELQILFEKRKERR